MKQQSFILTLLLIIVLFCFVGGASDDRDENRAGSPPSTSDDRIWKLSASSLRGGKGPEEVLESDISNFMSNVVFEQDASVLYLDSVWAFDSKRGFDVIQDLYGNITATRSDKTTNGNHNIPIYVYSYHSWAPSHPFFQQWWTHHYATIEDFPSFQFTKYRAIMLVLKGDTIVQGMLNVASGEGGGFCIHKIVMNALGLPVNADDMTANEMQYYNNVCVDRAEHPERAKSLFMYMSPCGWSSSEWPSWCNVSNYHLYDEL